MSVAQTATPDLILGTAMWAWSIPKAEAFKILDTFYAAGFRRIDTATNYPINKNTADFRAAEKILHEWIKVNNINDLRIICKYGSVNNLFTPEVNLTESFTLISAKYYRDFFGNNAEMLMPHWDNRHDKNEIIETFAALQTAEKDGWKIGLSGIKFPEIYAEINRNFNFDFSIEIKHNPFESAYPHYAPFHDEKRRFLTYGTTGGGVKLNGNYDAKNSLHYRRKTASAPTDKLTKAKEILQKANTVTSRPPLAGFWALGMLNAFYAPQTEGIILGVSSVKQAESSMESYRALAAFDYGEIYAALIG